MKKVLGFIVELRIEIVNKTAVSTIFHILHYRRVEVSSHEFREALLYMIYESFFIIGKYLKSRKLTERTS